MRTRTVILICVGTALACILGTLLASKAMSNYRHAQAEAAQLREQLAKKETSQKETPQQEYPPTPSPAPSNFSAPTQPPTPAVTTVLNENAELRANRSAGWRIELPAGHYRVIARAQSGIHFGIIDSSIIPPNGIIMPETMANSGSCAAEQTQGAVRECDLDGGTYIVGIFDQRTSASYAGAAAGVIARSKAMLEHAAHPNLARILVQRLD